MAQASLIAPATGTGGDHLPVPVGGGPWVEAAPFRAQLRHLMGVAHLNEIEVALLAGLSPRFGTDLLHGRRGRPVRRINSEQATRLLKLTPADLSLIARGEVLASLAARPARQLLAAGWSREELADRLGMSDPDLAALLHGQTAQCRHLVALRATAEAAALGKAGAAVPDTGDAVELAA